MTTEQIPSQKPIGYGRALYKSYVAITLCSFSAYAVVVGFARFSYGLFLPAIKADFGGYYTIYGTVATANFTGYLLGTLSIPFLANYFRRRPTITVTVLTSISLSLSATSNGISSLIFWRFVIGIFSGMATVLIMSDVLGKVTKERHGRAAGLTWMGASFGITLTGLVAPIVIDPERIHAWRLAWFVMGFVGLIVSIALARTLLNAEVNSMPQRPDANSPRIRETIGFLLAPRSFMWITLAYFSYGFGYIIYMTYLVSALVSQGLSPTYIGLIWAGMGMAGMMGGSVWGYAVDRRPSGSTLAGSLAVGAIASLTILTGNVMAELLGAVVFGLAVFVGPPLIINVLLKQDRDPDAYASTLSFLVAIFSAGQLLGPLLGGYVVDRGGISAGGVVTFFALGIGAICAWAYGLVSLHQRRT